MLGLGAFRRKPREFEYKPRFYDPEKEARDERRRELFGDQSESPQGDGKEYKPGQYIRKSMYARRGIGVKHKSGMSSVKVRRAIFALLILFAMLIWILN